ncbi:archaemetzincin [Pelagicoccus sp. SDUM812003]|uniref:archaemetzincin n=1 Tax=Pelagicoccus sp. SDUM812003 TaxID=3041267 RepID=UPI00280F145E|nr:archaemetzincin [Pelagicoccus sp. SDUM812003]MDQ8203060.1 archaemetzincin [Pelagicoccus sp. SDUM812003]
MLRLFHRCLALLSFATALAGEQTVFTPPTAAERVEAIGELSALPEEIWPAFLNLDAFQPLPRPGPMDWLSVRKESGQSVSQYLNDPNVTLPSDECGLIYIQPIGKEVESSIELPLLSSYCTQFFNTEAKLLPMINWEDRSISTRTGPFGDGTQLNARDILQALNAERPADAYAVIGITMMDLYPDDSWNFVFGLANTRSGVGVFSFARYGSPAANQTLVLERTFKVMTHEIGHMYGMKHCIYFHCLLNGSNGLSETDAAPLHLCPVCLRKLHLATSFDPLIRYATLNRFYVESGLESAADFTSERMRCLLRPAK